MCISSMTGTLNGRMTRLSLTMDGVEEARVNFKSGKAVIKYNDRKVTIARLREVINDTGFFCDVQGSPGRKGR